MTQKRQYADQAERQRAYRKRKASHMASLLSDAPAQTFNPAEAKAPTARWNTRARKALFLLYDNLNEMNRYIEARSEPWHDSESANQFMDRLASLLQTVEILDDIFPGALTDQDCLDKKG